LPGDKTRHTIARQWELLNLLPNGGVGKTASILVEELAGRGFDVSKRQVERDLNDLRENFPAIECNDGSKPYGWRWARGRSMDIPGITLAEALSLHLIEDAVRPLLPASILEAVEPRFQQAKAKLAGLPKAQRYARWPDKVRTVPTSLSLEPPVVKAEVLECIQNALIDEKQVEVEYRSMDSPVSSTYTLHPLALVQYGAVTYLVAAAFDYEDPRIYAVHRMLRAEPLSKKSRRPEGFNLDEYVNRAAFQFGSGEVFKLIAKVKSELARILEETPLSEDQLMSGRRMGFVR
jgi:predicted DNA-binding transcriptional regulator YafY